MVVGGKMVGDTSNNYLSKAYNKGKLRQVVNNYGENANLLRKLKEIGEKDGIKINISPYNSVPGVYSKTINPKTKEILEEEIGSSAYAGTLAHELGHSRHFKGRDGSKLGKLAHKLDNTTRNPKVSTTALIGSGLVSGIRAGMKKEKDEKVSTLNKLTPALTGAAVFLPTVGAEIAASRRGYKLLKKSGASNEYLKHHTKNMKAALGTYLTSAGYKTVVSGYGSREFGKLIGREIAADQKRKEKRKNKDK